MKVRITNERRERDEMQRGFAKVFKTPAKITFYEVTLHLDLSEEERAILTEYDLWDIVVYTGTLTFMPDELRANPGLAGAEGDVEYRIEDFASDDGFHRSFPTPLEATNFANKLRLEILPNLKKYIDQSRESGPGSTSAFEL
jgi:hypothetical protein